MNANEYRGEVSVEIGGEKRILVLDWDSLARLKDDIGDNVFIELDQMVAAMDVDKLSRFLAEALRRYWPEVTPEEIRRISPPLMSAQKALMEVFHLAYFGSKEAPVEEPEENPLGQNGLAGTGSMTPEAPPSSAG